MNKMLTFVTVSIYHEDMETLETTIQEMKEIMQYMTNIKRKFEYEIGRTQDDDGGVGYYDDGQDQ